MAMIKSFTTSNADLEAAFRKDEAIYEELAKEALARSSDEVVHAKRRDRSVPVAYWEKVKKLELYYVQLQRQGWFECAKASLGPSSVGFMWVHPAADPPRPSPETYIYLKKLTPQWYLFRRQQ